MISAEKFIINRNLYVHISPTSRRGDLAALCLNRILKSKDTSQHVLGEAADIHLPTKAHGPKYATFIQSNCLFDQLLLETDSHGNTWLHVSCRYSANRRYTNLNYKA